MSDDRQNDRRYWWNADRWWSPADRWRLSYISAGLGFGLLASGLGILVTSGPLIFSAIAALIGAILLAYGLQNY